MNVLVFRKRLLAYSETFIAEQGVKLPLATAIFTGFEKDDRGFHLLAEKAAEVGKSYELCLEADSSKFPKLTGALHKRLGYLNPIWLKKLSGYTPALIHAHFGPDGLAAAPLAKRLGIPLITTFHGFDITIDKPLNSYRKNRHKVFEQSHRIIAVSKFIRDKLVENGCPSEKITQHYIGIDTEKFKPGLHPPVPGRVLFVGRLVSKKGAQYLIEAMHRLVANNPAAHLRVVGDGPLRTELEALSLAGPCNIEFLGRKTPAQVVEEVQQAQILCAPSVTSSSGDQEGLGMNILEAMAGGTPVVASCSGGIVEVVEEGVNGFLVPERDVESISKRLEMIISNAELRGRLSDNARQTAVQKYNLRTQCALLEEIYRDVAGLPVSAVS